MIKLLTIIGHGVNLLPHFINHYKNYVDEINIVVYETNKNKLLANEVSKIIENQSNVKIVKIIEDRIYDWDKVTALYNYIKSRNPNDWWVISDIDEFHLYPNDDLRSLVNDCEQNGWEMVRGGFIDRIGIDGEFPKIESDKVLWEQFPNAGFFRYPMSKACPNKVCLVKGYLPITSGQHYAKINGETTWRWQAWNHPLIAPVETHSVQVHHFKWDETAINRILDVASIKQDYSFSDEYFTMYNEIRKSSNKINLLNPDFMFELGLTEPKFNGYRQWNKLIKKIISI
jgi:hypothetical protein